MCHLPIRPHETLDECTINMIPMRHFSWYDAEGMPWDITSMIMFNGNFATDGEVPWPKSRRENHVIVARIEGKSISSQLVKHMPNQTVEDLLAAEQIILGPSERVHEPRNHANMVVDPFMLLKDLSVLVYRVIEAHRLIEIQIQMQNVIR